MSFKSTTTKLAIRDTYSNDSAIRAYPSSGLLPENIVTNALKAIGPKAGPLLPDNWI